MCYVVLAVVVLSRAILTNIYPISWTYYYLHQWAYAIAWIYLFVTEITCKHYEQNVNEIEKVDNGTMNIWLNLRHVPDYHMDSEISRVTQK